MGLKCHQSLLCRNPVYQLLRGLSPGSPTRWSVNLVTVKSIPRRQIPPLTGTNCQPFPSPNRRFPGKFQFLRAHYLSRLLAKKRGTRVSLEYLSSSQEPGNRRPSSPQAPVLRSSCQVTSQIINFLNLPSLSCQVAALDS